VRLELPASGRGELRLLDASGRVHRQWGDLAVPATIDWDGRDARGRALAGGVYFLVFTPAEQAAAPAVRPALSARVVLVRGR
jgi:hypothetical protein